MLFAPVSMYKHKPTIASQARAGSRQNLVQINVSSEELQQRIQNFIERKRQQVNISNIHDFIPGEGESETEDTETCARVRAQFVKRNDSKGHLKIRKVHNEWGPQTAAPAPLSDSEDHSGLPPSIAERVVTIEKYLNITPVSKDVFKRLKDMEDKMTFLQSVSPEYANFWKTRKTDDDANSENLVDYAFSADDIAKKIEQLEKVHM
ncbi:molybdopterin synthase catalytic subunit-like [Manduca sexta]|uniref:molybdopterin synthase catalytic subunit-like n=1 Tax=Manduca sexta TaxID=7130 RepID=UPI00188DD7E3|nr:molybdopterin synthase catalytic subunit-like [Manduca sexta]